VVRGFERGTREWISPWEFVMDSGLRDADILNFENQKPYIEVELF
jgi:hypothetical protein